MTFYGDYASLCLQTLERPNALKECLTSLRKHTHFPHELLIHDDGSTHPRVQRLLYRAWKRGNISSLIFGNPPGYNTGPGVPLHRLFQCSHGRFIVKLDADLAFDDGWLEQAVKVFEVFPEVVWLGLIAWPREDPKTFIRAEKRGGLTLPLHWKGMTSAFMVRRTSLEPLGHLPEFSTSFSDDVTLCGKVFPGLCLCRDDYRPHLKALEDGWLAILPVTHPIPGSGTTIHIHDKEGKVWRRPVHSHPRVFGDHNKFPIVLTRLRGRPASQPLSRQPMPALEDIAVPGTAAYSTLQLTQEASA